MVNYPFSEDYLHPLAPFCTAMKKLVIVGGGHAHVEVLREFGLRKLSGVDITVVSPDRRTPYSGMLPGLVAGHYTVEQCHIDLQSLAAYAGARLVTLEARTLDAARRVLTLSDGGTLDYDVASINTGSVPLAQTLPGVAQHAIPVKPVAGFLQAWEALIVCVRAGTCTIFERLPTADRIARTISSKVIDSGPTASIVLFSSARAAPTQAPATSSAWTGRTRYRPSPGRANTGNRRSSHATLFMRMSPVPKMIVGRTTAWGTPLPARARAVPSGRCYARPG